MILDFTVFFLSFIGFCELIYGHRSAPLLFLGVVVASGLNCELSREDRSSGETPAA
jgi:hypothetical protein